MIAFGRIPKEISAKSGKRVNKLLRLSVTLIDVVGGLFHCERTEILVNQTISFPANFQERPDRVFQCFVIFDSFLHKCKKLRTK